MHSVPKSMVKIQVGLVPAIQVLTLADWTYVRECICAPAAEFFGAFILCVFGCGGNCQAVLSSDTRVSASPAGVSSRY